MTKKERKMAVLMALQKKNAPASLSDLQESLGPVFAERTLRRWLNEMVPDYSTYHHQPININKPG